jgi:protein-S-isoprenylcysteine O-methyltransferase Ste14
MNAARAESGSVVSLRFRPDISSKRDGIYGLVRNPNCLGLLLPAFGWVLAFRSGVGAVMAASLLVPLIGWVSGDSD